MLISSILVMEQSMIQAQDADVNNAVITEKNAEIIWLGSAVIAALVASIFNIILAGFKYFLGERRSERAARRVYEYEARKRLYREFEPLSFQLSELSEIATRRIRGLAREAREGNLDPGKSWYSDANSYHMINAIYRLLAPLAVFRLMQRNLTIADIMLDESVNSRYTLAKVLYYSFQHDVRLAKLAPSICYRPRESSEQIEQKIKENPRVYKEQGIYHQSLVDTMTDALIDGKSDDKLRIISFKEFADKYRENKNHEPFDTMGSLLEDFHPKTRPVLWLILVLQLHIYQILVKSHNNKKIKDIPSSIIPDEIFSFMKGRREEINGGANQIKHQIKDQLIKKSGLNHLKL